MENLVSIMDVMFVIFVVGAIVRVTKIVTLMKRHGYDNVHLALSEREEKDDIYAYESMDTIVSMCMNIAVIFGWLYVHFWMK